MRSDRNRAKRRSVSGRNHFSARGSIAYGSGRRFSIAYKASRIASDTARGYAAIGTVTNRLDVMRRIAADGVAPGADDPADGRPKDAVTIDSFHLH